MSHPVFTSIRIEDTENPAVALVTIQRPEKLNALNAKVLEELDAVIDHIEATTRIHGVVLTGDGDKAFVAGADIAELRDLDGATGSTLAKRGQDIFMRIERSRALWVAAVNGYALGGGAELALACAMRVGNARATIGLPEVSLGLIPGYGGTQRLTRLLGSARAIEMICTGAPVKAEEAHRLGLLNRLAREQEGETVVQAALNLLGAVMKNAPLAVHHARKAVLHAAGPQLDPVSGYQYEATLFGDLCGSEDFKEGTGAFLEKRKPDFKGR